MQAREYREDDEGTIRAAAIDPYQPATTYPIGTVALYGPDDLVTTKIVASVVVSAEADPILERFVGTDVTINEKVQQQIRDFFGKHGVTSVAATDGNIGCPHEEGEDFPLGENCPFCPFWKGKQGSVAAMIAEPEPASEEQSMMQMLEAMSPELLSELTQLAGSCESEEEFADLIMVGPCPKCDSDNTNDCEDDPVIDDPCIGRCGDCGQLWCCDCGDHFTDAKHAAQHECPVWEEIERDLDESL